MRFCVILVAAVLCGCSQSEPEPDRAVAVARICRDGSHIFKYRDGSYHTSWGYAVEDLDKVCQP